MTALDKLRAAPPEVREAALALMDEISRPLTVRELDNAFRDKGFTRSQRRKFVRALNHLPIIAVGADQP